MDQAINIAYIIDGQTPFTLNMKAVFLAFINGDIASSPNPSGLSCPNSTGLFYSYQTLYSTLPEQCVACNQTCLTCIGSNTDPTFTSASLCTSCGALHYYIPDGNQNYGRCECLPGLLDDPLTVGGCLECEFNCLGFIVEFISS